MDPACASKYTLHVGNNLMSCQIDETKKEARIKRG